MSRLQGKMQRFYLLRMVLPTAAFLLPMLGMIGFVCVVWPAHIARDTRSTAQHRAEARVIAVTPIPADRFNDGYSQVTVRLDNSDLACFCSVPVRVGDRVRVDYRVGQSGRIYVGDIKRIGP